MVYFYLDNNNPYYKILITEHARIGDKNFSYLPDYVMLDLIRNSKYGIYTEEGEEMYFAVRKGTRLIMCSSTPYSAANHYPISMPTAYNLWLSSNYGVYEE